MPATPAAEESTSILFEPILKRPGPSITEPPDNKGRAKGHVFRCRGGVNPLPSKGADKPLPYEMTPLRVRRSPAYLKQAPPSLTPSFLRRPKNPNQGLINENLLCYEINTKIESTTSLG